MLIIRFQRVGRRNDPSYRIVVCEKRSKPKTSGIEILGSYYPKTKAAVLKNDRLLYWLSKGAKASDTVHNFLIKNGVIAGKKINVVRVSAAVTSATEKTASAPVEKAVPPVSENMTSAV